MKIRIAAVAAVLLLSLAGCAGAPDEASSAPASAAQTASEPTESPAPLVAEAAEKTAYASDDERFLGELAAAYERRADLQTQIPNATDEQLIAAGHAACDQLPSIGYETTLAHVIEGETPNGLGTYQDSAIIAAIAVQVYCPVN